MKNFGVEDDVSNLEESSLASLFEDCLEGAKFMNVSKCSFATTKIGTLFTNFSNITINLSVDLGVLKDFLNENGGRLNSISFLEINSLSSNYSVVSFNYNRFILFCTTKSKFEICTQICLNLH